MSNNKKHYELSGSKFTTKGDIVKAKIYALGINLSEVAEAARLTNAQVTKAIHNPKSTRALRVRLLKAVRGLTGLRSLPFDHFWPDEDKGVA